MEGGRGPVGWGYGGGRGEGGGGAVGRVVGWGGWGYKGGKGSCGVGLWRGEVDLWAGLWGEAVVAVKEEVGGNTVYMISVLLGDLSYRI